MKYLPLYPLAFLVTAFFFTVIQLFSHGVARVQHLCHAICLLHGIVSVIYLSELHIVIFTSLLLKFINNS